jgi:hypothetical protein
MFLVTFRYVKDRFLAEDERMNSKGKLNSLAIRKEF